MKTLVSDSTRDASISLAYPTRSLRNRVLEGLDDGAALEWSLANGRKPTEDEIFIWNEFMRKRGWNDEATEILNRRKRESGLWDRDDIQTMFDYIDADEGKKTHPAESRAP